MAGISIMAPFVATVIATASPNPQTSTAGLACPFTNPTDRALYDRYDLQATGVTVPRQCDLQAPSLIDRTIHDRNDEPENQICSNC